MPIKERQVVVIYKWRLVATFNPVNLLSHITESCILKPVFKFWLPLLDFQYP